MCQISAKQFCLSFSGKKSLILENKIFTQNNLFSSFAIVTFWIVPRFPILKQNYEKAFERYIFLDKRDDFELSDYIYRNLGDYYRYGYGEIEIDLNKALEYYFTSYNAGDLFCGQSGSINS